ncbi:DUF3102 domain-containing protein [Chlorogloea sp. CCALA 695]|uniref:DUF3102 domain-containing protein n=1 Tax=Chlorogloea sp. CCALA 695 TaxID=2107693 RepID=UPI000D07B049|nr:DUF3102 domain-containing protein [Chlorogloea sp. CCALA 695]PSB28358.1 hypothetical protein C7B70_21115 [Chlorogloea sp. CCALA 695]
MSQLEQFSHHFPKENVSIWAIWVRDKLGSFFNQSESKVIKIENAVVICVIFMTASPKAWKKFDYTALDVSTSQFVQQQTGEIRGLMKRTVESIFEIGQRLIIVKERLGHGRFGSWLETEFEWSQDTANHFINVAKKFGKFTNVSEFDMAASALYMLAAPSTPDAARDEALARAKAGESITYKTAKSIKQKYTLPSAAKLESALKQEVQPVPQLLPLAPSSTSSRIKQEIVAIRNTTPVELPSVPSQSMASAPEKVILLPQSSTSASIDDERGVWWQLGAKHLLYSGDPNSLKFLARVPSNLSLLFAFPPAANWQPLIEAKTRIVTDNYLPQGKDVRLFEDTLESILILYSSVGETIVSCFMPSIEILSILNRQDRRALIAEPDSKRVNAIVSDWKLAGLKVERIS